RTRAAASADVLLAWRQILIDPERRLPRDLAGVGVDGDQPRPWRPLTGKHDVAPGGVLAHRRRERVERTDAVDRRAVVRLLRAHGVERIRDAGLLLLDPPDKRRVVRVHIDVAGARIGGRAAPV